MIRPSEFYGFGAGQKGCVEEQLRKFLEGNYGNHIYENDTGAEVVEEIIRRGGEFFDGPEADKIVPFEKTDGTIPVARYKYLDGEARPSKITYAIYNYAVISFVQYEYGLYLQELIRDGDLKPEDIIIRNPNRVKFEPWLEK